jgi:hypothetical protein|nr:MAG TPA: hypothetical protein [Caudoviricetes sp.]
MSKIKIFKEILTAVGIWSLVGLSWQILEILMYGEVRPRSVDTIVTAVLSLSLYINLEMLE